MTETPPGGSPPADDDLGPPAIELRELAEEPRHGFFKSVRRSIDRRTLTGHLAEQAWSASIAVILEFIKVALGLFTADDEPKRGERRE